MRPLSSGAARGGFVLPPSTAYTRLAHQHLEDLFVTPRSVHVCVCGGVNACAHEWSPHWGNACVRVVNLSGVNARVCERVWDM